MKFPDDMLPAERRKLSAALYIRAIHRDLTPKSQDIKTDARERVTWRQWWERKYNDDYSRYIRQNWQHFKPEQPHEAKD